ncbi:MAG: imidazolonepropionase [Candidatus Sericytochromatia bacterium]|nr:imidazolonepropionase [Candidatus Sericytochromatia bacterium]
MVAAVDWLLRGARLVTPAGESGPLAGPRQGELIVHDRGAVALAGGRIVAAGAESAVLQAVGTGPGTREVDLEGRLLTPGLIDAHTHPVYAGLRLDDFERRARGATYGEILAAGGGIHETVRRTRAATVAELVTGLEARLDRFLACGTTTIEAKSGYGLDTEAELAQLEVIASARHPVARIPTWLGAHAVPPGTDPDEAIDRLIEESLPAVAAQGIARFADIFCEHGVYTTGQAERLLTAARANGLGLKLHADELVDTGGAALAARLGAVSADHLHVAHSDGLAAMAAAGTLAVLLPGTGMFLGMREPAPARTMIAAGVPVAVATDHNPGSSPAVSLPLMMTLAVTQLRLTPAEAFVGVTANAAAAVGQGDRLGRILPGKQADLVAWDLHDWRELAYHVGSVGVAGVWIAGRGVRGALANASQDAD